MCKVRDLVGVESGRFHDRSTKNYGALAKELLRNAKVNRSTVDDWRVSSGVMVIQVFRSHWQMANLANSHTF